MNKPNPDQTLRPDEVSVVIKACNRNSSLDGKELDLLGKLPKILVQRIYGYLPRNHRAQSKRQAQFLYERSGWTRTIVQARWDVLFEIDEMHEQVDLSQHFVDEENARTAGYSGEAIIFIKFYNELMDLIESSPGRPKGTHKYPSEYWDIWHKANLPFVEDVPKKISELVNEHLLAGKLAHRGETEQDAMRYHATRIKNMESSGPRHDILIREFANTFT